MTSKSKILRTTSVVLCMVSMLFIFHHTTQEVKAASGYELILLGTYSETMNIGDSFYLPAVTSNGKKPTFSSGDSKVASVNTYGKITAKGAGSTVITAKIKNGEASCKIKVKKTAITLNSKSLTLENGSTAQLTAEVSTKHPVKWKSAKKSIASVDEDGMILAKKPGTTEITASADGTTVSCKVKVKQPTVCLSKTKVSLYRKDTVKLTVSSTSSSEPKWKSSKKSVALVDNRGKVTAVKNGTAWITVTVDGVSRQCEVTVKKPKITFEEESLTLKEGETASAKATVSSGNLPEYSSSNTNVAAVNEQGKITAKSPGRAYIYAKEDGTKERMTVYVK